MDIKKSDLRLLASSLALAALILTGCARNTGQAKNGARPEQGSEYGGTLRISELMAKNQATLMDENGDFPDWIEIENCSDAAVELEGWSLSDGEDKPGWSFPSGSIGPGEFLVVFCGGGTGTDFALSAGERVCLWDPAGTKADCAECGSGGADTAVAREKDGAFRETPWATPGYPNSREGYEAFCAFRPHGALVINELMVSNLSYAPAPGREPGDWVEIKNTSAEAVELSGYALSDSSKELRRWRFPEYVLGPGETLLIYCSGDEAASADGYLNTGFSLNAVAERLYLSDESGALSDYVFLHDLPINGSLGRMDGENGFFYFTKPSPWEPNFGGERMVSRLPQTLTPDGAYDETPALSVELSGEGKLYYTTDGSVPSEASELYTGPISIDKTTVIRAVAVEEGCIPSRVATFSYMLNENHSLPVLSLVVDDRQAFDSIYSNGRKHVDVPANLAFYAEQGGFNQACCVSMKGKTSLSLPKKSMGVSFRGMYGGALNCDVFGNGINEYSSLSIRAGQDYTFSIFRNELFQELCLDMNGSALTQESRYCVLYINGEYRGIYCLKEDLSRQFYASHANVSRDSVSAVKTPVGADSDFFREVLAFCWQNDLSTEENYRHICELVDIDSFIDWFIIESYSANTDIQGNVQLYRSTENGGRWVFAVYDLDWGFYSSNCDFTMIAYEFGNVGNQMPALTNALLKNAEFRDRLLSRFAELNRTVLSNACVLEKIDRFQALLEPEAARDRERWGLRLDSWYHRVDELRALIVDNDWETHNIDQLCMLLKLSREEREAYFGA